MEQETKAVLMHPTFERAFDVTHAFCSVGEVGAVCFITGASGAGKTTLVSMLIEAIYGERSSWQKGRIHGILVNANNHQQGRFSQKKLIFDLFSALEDPFRSDPKIALPGDVLAGSEVPMDEIAEWRWTTVVEKLARARGVELLIVDEAEFMCLAPGRRSPADYVEAIRSLAYNAKIRIILAGTYDLLEVWNHSAAINRRCLTVHIGRYKNKNLDDRKKFLGVLKGVEKQRHLPDGLLTSRAQKIYQTSYGIPGEVYSSVSRAEIFRVAEGGDKMTWHHFEESCQLPAQLERLKAEADIGERILFSTQPSPSVGSDTGSTSANRRNRKPGRRSATRYPTGSSP